MNAFRRNRNEVKLLQWVRFGDGKGSVCGIALGDLDKDGFLDIVVGIGDSPNKAYLSEF